MLFSVNMLQKFVNVRISRYLPAEVVVEQRLDKLIASSNPKPNLKQKIRTHGVRRKQLSGEEFIERLLSGERDFSKTSIRAGTHLDRIDGYAEMLTYLRNEALLPNILYPFDLSNSLWHYITAPELFLPFINATSFRAPESNLQGINFAYSNLNFARFKGTYLAGAKFKGASLYKTNFRDADVTDTDTSGTNLSRTIGFRENLERRISPEVIVDKAESTPTLDKHYQG